MPSSDVDRILEKLDEIQSQRYANGLRTEQIDGRVKAVEGFIGEHKLQHRDDTKHKRNINIKLWLMLAGGFVSVMIMILKDSLF